MKASLRYRTKIDTCERLHEPRLHEMSKVFPLASVELGLSQIREREKSHKVRQAAFSSPAVQADKDQRDKWHPS